MSVRDQVLAVTRDPADAITVLGLLDRIAARQPGRPALRCGSRTLTYAELVEGSTNLARKLAGAGVFPQDVVAVRAADRFNQVNGLFAVWRAGGTYLAIDPEAPTDRTGQLLGAIDVRLVLDGSGTGLPPATAELPPPDPARLAYLVHTSGSTGTPKPVAVTHGALASHIPAAAERFGIAPDDVVLYAAQSFVDVAIEQVCTALATGACLVPAPAGLPSAAGLLDLLTQEQITVANVAAGLFHELVTALYADRTVPKTLHTMVSGSDVLSADAAADWLRRTGVRLLNAYGPTEAVVTATVHEVRETGPVLIGLPLGGRHPYVLDDALRPVDQGELYLGGNELAVGYLGHPARTANSFVADPFGSPGTRMYRTGDLVRRTAAGLEFAGRIDGQVKIRGFRVELGEVEHTLGTHPAVSACAVAAYGPAGARRLAAYVVGELTLPAMREFLATGLPDHLVPTALTTMDRLPLTPAGQLDRAALPAPEAPTGRGQAPRTPAEQLVGGIWSDVLDAHDVGLDDNFFHLGGDSLTAVRVAARMLTAFGAVSPYLIFDAPTLGEYAAAVEHGLTPATVDGPVRADARSVPLSPFQRGLWLADYWHPGTSTYNVPWVFDLAGQVDVSRLRQALLVVVGRHDVLRSTVEIVGSEPCLVIHDGVDVPLLVSTVADPGEATALIRADAQEPFDLATGPLLRVRLIMTGPVTASLVMVLHHIVWDEASLTVLDRELRAAYEQRELPVPAVRYADYAVWSREREVATASIEYWAQRLRDLPAVPLLPPDHAGPAEPGHPGGHHRFAFDPALAQAVRTFARGADATPFMVLLAGLVLALHRAGGATDLVVGTPVSVRDRSELDELIGYFINPVPLRFQLNDGATAREIVHHVREVALGAYRHHDVPIADLTDLVRRDRGDDADDGLFQVIFEMHQADPHPLSLGDISMSRQLWVNELNRFDVSWSVEDDGTGFTGRIEYDSTRFDAGTLAVLGDRWQAELAAMVAAPDAVASGPAERHAADTVVHAAFERQVRRTPDVVALCAGDTEVTYTALNRMANKVARYLLTRGAGPGDVVAVLVERGVDLVSGLLGVLKAGAAYTLIDPDLPARRRQELISDAGPRLVLTRDELAAAARVERDGDVDVDVTPDAAACVMFTSGSTGRPKGVLTTHRALTSTYFGQDYATFAADEVWLQCSPVSWDAFGLELYGALLFGGRCVLHPGQRPDPQTLTDLVLRHSVTQLQLSASLFNLLVDGFPQVFTPLRVVFTGGERASATHVARLRARHPDLRIVNGYGPVESLGFTTSHQAGPADDTEIPIGRPLPGKGIRVLDERYDPAERGELYATGAGLAFGYLGRGGLTAARFLPDPAGPPGARMYRTGDLGHRDADGVLHISGRIDDQVKIRGFRVEPGEVTAALATCPGVADAAVVAHEPVPGQPRLAAYLTTAAGTPPTETEVHDHLARLLPDYMLPATVTVVSALPLTANGKLDRDALPPPPTAGDAAAESREAVTTAERLVAAVWSEVLGVGAVGLHDNFFRLGGNSLAAVQVALRLSTETGTRVTPRLVFATKTVHALASRLPTS